MLTTMSKRVSRQQLVIHGHLTSREVYELKQDGWRVEWRDKPAGKHGIPQEGARPCVSANYAARRSKRRRASKTATVRSVNGNTKKQKRSS